MKFKKSKKWVVFALHGRPEATNLLLEKKKAFIIKSRLVCRDLADKRERERSASEVETAVIRQLRFANKSLHKL